MSEIDKKLNELLIESGLSPSEAKIYTSVEVGEKIESSHFIYLTNLPRATVQAGLKSLIDAGLCVTTQKDSKSYYYEMLPLDNLKKSLGRDKQITEDLITRVDQISRDLSLQDKLITQSAEDQLVVMDFLNLALHCKDRKWNIISPYDNAIRYMPAGFVDYFKKTRAEREIISQTLWEEKWKKKNINLGDILTRKPRFVPTKIAENIPVLILSFDNNLLIVSGTTAPSAEMITNQSVVDTFNIVFELAWRSCK